MEYKQMGADSALFNLLTPDVIVDIPKVVGALKPGAHLLALNPIATHHSNTIGIEDAGMEIRDTIAWVFANERNDVGMKLVTIARKPLEGTVAENVLKWGTGGLNIDKCRVGTELISAHGGGKNENGRKYGGGKGIPAIAAGSNSHEGRWPANLTHDNSPAVQSMFPNSKTARIEKPCPNPEITGHKWGSLQGNRGPRGYDGDGSAARFFYSAPCLNNLLAYLIKLVTPPNGTVLTNCDTENLPSEYNYTINCG